MTTPKPHPSGFTLLEVLAVLSILSIFASLAFPAMRSWQIRMREKAEVRSLVNAFQQARAEAARQNCDVLLEFTPASDSTQGGFSMAVQDGSGNRKILRPFSPLSALSLVKSKFGSRTDSGFDFRGVPLGGAGSVKLQSLHSQTVYEIRQNAYGGVRVK